MINLNELRKKDFTSLIETPIRNIGGKRCTLCMFHDERTPSFYIYPDNTFYCFGCQARGNAIDFVMRKFSYTFTHACELLNNL